MVLRPRHIKTTNQTSIEKTTEDRMRMSAVQSQSTLESKLEALQCHFTWDLGPSRSKLFRLRDKLEDGSTDEGNTWLGHIYNLQGYIHFQLGFISEARSFLCRAAEAFRQIRNTVSEEGPWLMVNYGNQAWLHHRLGEEAESQASLSKVEALVHKYPPPSQDELHAETYAEKAWSLMKFSRDQKLLAADYFQRAVRMQPDVVEWQTSHVLALMSAFKHHETPLRTDILEKMRVAKEHDPENLYLAALYLEACAKKGDKIEEGARDLARRVLTKPVSSDSAIKPLLKLFSIYISVDEATDLAEEAVERHPGKRHLKRCAALCYERRILLQEDNPLERSMVERAVSLCGELTALYPHSSLKTRISLANICTQTNYNRAAADQMYEDLLAHDLDPEETQMLYHHYAKHLQVARKDSYKSIDYHMRAAAIPRASSYRDNSIRILRRIGERNRNRMCGEIQEFLTKL